MTQGEAIESLNWTSHSYPNFKLESPLRALGDQEMHSNLLMRTMCITFFP